MQPKSQPNLPAQPSSSAKLVATINVNTDGVQAVAFSPDRGLLAIGGREGIGRVWDVGGNPHERGTFGGEGARFQSLAFSPNGRMLVAGSGSLDGLVRLMDVSEKAPKETAVLRGARGAINALAFSPDGKLVAGAGEDRTLRIWEPGPSFRGEARTQLTGHTGVIRALAFAPDGQSIATAARETLVRIWSLSRIRSSERATLPHPKEASAVAWSPDGKTIATACQDGVIRLWDPTAAKSTPRADLTGNATTIRHLTISDDNQMLVAVSDGPHVSNWDPRSALPLHEWDISGGPCVSVAVTVDGRYLAAGRSDGKVGIYRIAQRRA